MSVLGELLRLKELIKLKNCSALTVSRSIIRQCFIDDPSSLNKERGMLLATGRDLSPVDAVGLPAPLRLSRCSAKS